MLLLVDLFYFKSSLYVYRQHTCTYINHMCVGDAYIMMGVGSAAIKRTHATVQ